MKTFSVQLSTGDSISACIPHEELVYGATALLIPTSHLPSSLVGLVGRVNGICAYHPITEEAIDVVVDDTLSTPTLLVPLHEDIDYTLAEKYGLTYKQVVAPYFLGKGKEALREDKDTGFRRSVVVVVYDEPTDKYLCVDCVYRVCRSFVMGGIEGDEDIPTTALREVAEETGYCDLTVDRCSVYELHNHFYADYKNINRYAYLYVVFAHTNSMATIPMTELELGKQRPVWLSREEIKDFLTVPNNQFIYEHIFDKDTPFTVDGMMINSSEYNGKLRSTVAKDIE
jgi:8-oxo-dGTP pyrophosphatase MutT (NUDIX family)